MLSILRTGLGEERFQYYQAEIENFSNRYTMLVDGDRLHSRPNCTNMQKAQPPADEFHGCPYSLRPHHQQAIGLDIEDYQDATCMRHLRLSRDPTSPLDAFHLIKNK